MHSNSSIFYNANSLLSSTSAVPIEKETQTTWSHPYESLPRPQPVSYCPEQSKPPPKVFETFKLEKDPNDPDSVTVIKDTFLEEVIDSSTTGIKSFSNRYKYCREVIKPITQKKSECCVTPKESECEDNTGEKVTMENSCDKKEPPCPKPACCPKPPPDPCAPEPPCPKPACCPKPPPDPCAPEKPPEKADKCCPKEPIEKPPKPPICCPAPAKPDCPSGPDDPSIKCCVVKCLKKEKKKCIDQVIGVKEPTCPGEKTSYYVFEKPKEPTCVTPSSTNSLGSCAAESFNSVVDTMKNFADTFYKKTKDVALLVASASCKNLGYCAKSDSDNACKKNSSKNGPKPCEFTEGTMKTDNSENKNFETPNESTHTLAIERSESAVSFLRETGFHHVVKNILAARLEEESPPLDRPNSAHQEQEYFHPINFLNTIKAKIFSFFDSAQNSDTSDDES